MKVLRDIKTKSSIDSLWIFSSSNIGEIKTPTRIGKLYLVMNKSIDINTNHRYMNDLVQIDSYTTISYYFDEPSLYRATMFSNRLCDDTPSPSVFMHIKSPEGKAIRYKHVRRIIKSFRKIYKTDFHVYEISYNMDFTAQKSAHLIGLLNKRVNLGSKWIQGKPYCHYYEPPNSSYRINFLEGPSAITPYSNDLWQINIKIQPLKVCNHLYSIEHAGREDWSWLYGKNKYFWFHYPTDDLIEKMGKTATIKSMWNARNHMRKKYKVTPYKFYNNYLREHRNLSELTRIEFDRFRWDPDESRC